MTTLTTATAPTTTTPARQLGPLEAVLVPVGYLALMIGGGIAFAAALAGGNLDGVGISLLTALVTFGTVGLTLAVRVRSLAPLLLHAPGTRWLWTGLGVGVALRLLAFVIFGLWIAFTGDAWNPHQDLADSAALGGWSFVAILALGGLVIPFAEELLFRGVLFGALRRYGPVLAGLVSATVFGLAHVWPPLVLFAFVVGVVHAWMRERSGSIWPAVVSHAVVNTLSIVMIALVA
jgi:membrane protease YdiL (CAAX protease family)